MKQLPITTEMSARINAAAGTEVDPNTVAVFECLAVSNQPIQKRGNIYNGSVMDPGFFGELANWVNSGKSVPLHAMHESDTLPTGRVFYAQPTAEGTRAQFYVPKNKGTVVDDINNGVIGSVSIGALPKQLLCSECGFDYRGPDAGLMNFIDQTCGNGHTVGQNGVHLKSVGVDAWYELSLCGTGASPNSKIMSRSKAMLAADTDNLHRLTANGLGPEAVILVTPPTEDLNMDAKEFLAQLTTSATEIATLKAGATAKDTEIATLTAAKHTAETALAAANTAKTAAELALTEANAKITLHAAVVTEFDATKAFLKEQAIKAAVASGKKEADVPEDTAGQIALINAAGAHLAQLVANGHADVTRTTGTKPNMNTPVSAFTTAR